MKRNLVSLSIVTSILLTLIGCSNQASKEFDLKQLTRVDVQVFTSENSTDETIITEEEKLKALREVFGRIEWEQNVKVEMVRKEDVKATLFFTYDKNMPERLFEYYIWFHQVEASATIIDKEKDAVGTLNKEDTKKLIDVLVDN